MKTWTKKKFCSNHVLNVYRWLNGLSNCFRLIGLSGVNVNETVGALLDFIELFAKD